MLQINDLICYPEVKQYCLISNYDGTEHRVTDAQLHEMFPDPNTLAEVKSGRHKTWFLVEY